MIVTLFFTGKNILEHYALVAVFRPLFQNLLYGFAKWTKKMSKIEKTFSNLEQ
jgi:hypothetical protein